MPFGGGNQKFPMGGMGFEGQQGMGSSPGGLLGNEMVTYPTFYKVCEDLFIVCVWLSFLLEKHPADFKHEDRLKEKERELQTIYVFQLCPDVLLVRMSDKPPAW